MVDRDTVHGGNLWRERVVHLKVVPELALAELIKNPESIATLPLEAVALIRAELMRLDTLLQIRVSQAGGQSRAEGNGEDRLLTVEEAAVKLNLSVDQLYRMAAKLPFTVRLGRKLLFSLVGIERYIRQRAGR
jgi:excisionase family DNA binding protein